MGKLQLKIKVDPSKLRNNNGLNIFELGSLIQFESHAWQGRKQLPQNITKKLTPNAKKQMVRANKDLIDKSHLLQINTVINDARNFVYNIANPFPIKGIHFISNDAVPVIKEKLDQYIIKLNEEVELFIGQYEQFITDAETELGQDDLFNIGDYPSVNDIKKRFSINYRFFELSIPKHIDEKIRNEESENFKKLIKQTEEMSILALREGFSDILKHLTNTLTGKLDGEDKRLSQSSIDKVKHFFESFKYKNIFNDIELENMLKSANEILEGIDQKTLSKDKDLTKLVNDHLNQVKNEVDKSIVSFKRKVTFI